MGTLQDRIDRHRCRPGWPGRFAQMVQGLSERDDVTVLSFRIADGASAEDLSQAERRWGPISEEILGFYREMDGLSLAWIAHADPQHDPAVHRYQDAPWCSDIHDQPSPVPGQIEMPPLAQVLGLTESDIDDADVNEYFEQVHTRVFAYSSTQSCAALAFWDPAHADAAPRPGAVGLREPAVLLGADYWADFNGGLEVSFGSYLALLVQTMGHVHHEVVLRGAHGNIDQVGREAPIVVPESAWSSLPPLDPGRFYDHIPPEGWAEWIKTSAAGGWRRCT